MGRVETCWCGGRAQLATAFAAEGDPMICLESKFHDPLADGRPEKITKLYIAGPMSGYPESNYPAFHKAEESLRKLGFEVVNPAHSKIAAGHYVDFLREDLRLMLDCHGVATLDGWWDSVGARNEVSVAGLLRMPVRSIAEWAWWGR